MSGPPNLDAVIGNCQIAALIDAGGAMVWACLPRPDADPVFSGLLSPSGAAKRGTFAIGMEPAAAHIRQRYVRTTVVVETLHEGPEASLRVTDFCPRFRTRDRIDRPAMIVRLLEAVAGTPVIRVGLQPTAAYGRLSPQVTLADHALRFHTGEASYRVTSDASLTAICEERAFTLSGCLAFILADDESIEQLPTAFARSLLEQTRNDWEEWVRGFTVCAFWYVNALAAIGRMEEARELFERLLGRRNSVGLLSEDLDPRTGELWGNFPQSYSMVGIIISALRLSRYWEDVV